MHPPSATNSTTSSVAETIPRATQPANTTFQDEPSETDIELKPWKYIGYKGYSDFIASENDFFILRRFDTLNVRVALLLQDELSKLEEQLMLVDKNSSRKEAPDAHNGTFRNEFQDRAQIMETIKKRIYRYSKLNYTMDTTIVMSRLQFVADEHAILTGDWIVVDKFILQQSILKRYPGAPRRDVKSVQRWHANHDFAAIAQVEQKYIMDHEDDLFCVIEKDKTPLRRLLDTSRHLRTLNIWRKGTEKDEEGDENAYVAYYSNKRLDGFVSVFIMAVGVVMPLVPIWILQAVDSNTIKLIVISVFIFVFLVVLSLAMATQPFEE